MVQILLVSYETFFYAPSMTSRSFIPTVLIISYRIMLFNYYNLFSHLLSMYKSTAVLFIFSINSSSEFISLVSKLYSANVFADVLINFSFNSLFSSSIFPAINPLSPSSSKPSEIGEPGYTIFFPT